MAIAALTGVLVLVTMYYAWQTRRTVDELREARGLQVRPKLGLTMRMMGNGLGVPRVQGAGTGPAFDVQTRLKLDPDGGEYEWKHPLIAPGESHDLMAPKKEGDPDLWKLDGLTSKYTTLRLTGTCRDALGAIHKVDEAIQLLDFWDANKMNHLLPDSTPEKVARSLDKIEGHLGAISRHVQRRAIDDMMR